MPMSFVRQWWGQLTNLTGQTVQVWWQVLPKVLIAWVAGWLVYRVALTSTASIQETHPWLTIVIFSTGLVTQLAALIVAIRIAGRPAGLWETLPPQVARLGRDEPLLKVVSVSLLPFVGVYAVFNGINEATYQLFIQGAINSATVLNPQSATTVLDPTTARQRLIIGAVLVISYIVKRALEMLADKFGRSVLGLAGALVEGFFSVVLIFGGSRMLGDLGDWLRDRVFYGWLMDAWEALSGFLVSLHIPIPQVISWSWQLWTEHLWPLFSDAMLAPLLWLAAAGLVFGTYTLSAAELWDKGQQRGVSGALARRHERLARLQARGLSASRGSRAVVLEFIEIFVGDIEDRFIPIIQSLRHVLRVGLPFTGAFILLYAVVGAVKSIVFYGLQSIIGGNVFQFWLVMQPPLDLISGVIGEPLRISLLAVAMTATLKANYHHTPARPDDLGTDESGASVQRVGAEVAGENRPGSSVKTLQQQNSGRRWQAAPAPVSPGLPSAVWGTPLANQSGPQAPTDHEHSTVQLLVAGGVTLACVLAAGFVTETVIPEQNTDLRYASVGERLQLVPGQTMQVTGLDAGTWLQINGDMEPAMVTEALFVSVQFQMTSDTHAIAGLTCKLYTPGPDGDLLLAESPVEDMFSTPQPGFTTHAQVVFERPADQLVGAELHCTPSAFYLAYEPEAVIELGIDEATQAELASKNGTLQVSDPVTEVTR